MNRMGVYCFYDKDGIVDNYTEYLLDEMLRIINKLVIVVNGNIQDDSYRKLEQKASLIIKRKNYGYDGGAYKDLFLNYLNPKEILEFDEVLLFNSSFWGPINSFDNLFSTMDKTSYDFWGLTKWLEGPSSMPGYSILPEHVQAYFLGIRSSILQSNHFGSFWKQMIIPTTYDEAIRNFEIAFTQFFYKKGFKYTTFIDEYRGAEYLKAGKVVYTSHAADLVKNCFFPVIKKKVIDFSNFNQIVLLDTYLKTNAVFKNLISSQVTQYEKDFFPYHNIDSFYKKHKKIYIFGHGQWGKNMEAYFLYKKWDFSAFLVSKDAKQEEKEVNFDEIELLRDDGVIVALGEEKLKEVYGTVTEKIDAKHLLLPNYL